MQRNTFRSYEVDKNGMIFSFPTLNYHGEAGSSSIIRMFRYVIGKIKSLLK